MGSYVKSTCPEVTSQDHAKNVLYTIKKSDYVGRYIVAARDIQPGEVIFTDQAACIGPDNSSKPLCLGCFRKVSGIYKCPRCHWPMCQPSCTASPYHIEECQLFMKRGAKITIPWYDRPCTYYDAILPLRVLLTKYHNPQVYYLINLLMDHNDSLDEATVKRRQTLVDFLRKTCKLANDFSNEEVHKVLGILSVNSFVVHDGGDNEANSDLIGLYPWTSLMSHNCIANTKITTREDFSYVCQATVLIPAGEEIVTNYHHYHYQFYGTPYRRADLKNTWSFECLCSRCKDPTEYGSYVSAMLCEQCNHGYILPSKAMDFKSTWKCDHCSAEFPHDLISTKLAKYESAIEDIKASEPKEFEVLLRKMSNTLHENHYWILDVKRRLIDIYGNKEGFELYKLPKELLQKKSEYCEHLLRIGKILCPGPSEMRGYLLWEYVGVSLRLAQWHWIRMKINTPAYLDSLLQIKSDLHEVISILGPIRKDSDEGQMGLKAKDELKTLNRLIEELSAQTYRSKNNTLQISSGKGNDSQKSSKSRTLNLHRTSMAGLTSITKITSNVENNNSSSTNTSTSRRSICI